MDNPDSEIQQYLGENGIVYTYNENFDVYAKSNDGKYQNTNLETDPDSSATEMIPEVPGGMMDGISDVMGSSSGNNAENFEELMPGQNGEMVSRVITDSYDVLYGNWPKNYNEVVLVLDKNNAIPTSVLYQMGLNTEGEYKEIKNLNKNGEEAKVPSWNYEDVNDNPFYLVPSCDYYVEN